MYVAGPLKFSTDTSHVTKLYMQNDKTLLHAHLIKTIVTYLLFGTI